MARSTRHDSDHDSVADDPARDRRPTAESTLAGYRLLRRVASGERADVFLAAVDGHDEQPAALVVVRVYEATASGETIATEIEAMSTDASGSLPALFDVATLDDGRCALAVERLSGPSIARVIAERRITPGEAVTILAPIVVATGELARHGFVHTRLSPGDVLLDSEGRPRLIGLGALERLPSSAHERTPLLRTGHVALADLVGEVAAATERPEVFAAAIELVQTRLSARPFASCEAELERALFDAAAPAPVRGVATAVRRGGLPSRVTVPLEADPSVEHADRLGDVGRAGEPEPRKRSLLRTMLALAQLPAFFAGGRRAGDGDDRVGRSAPSVDPAHRVRAALRRRRPALVVGALVGGGALVLLLTLVPPSEGETASAGAVPAVQEQASEAAVDEREGGTPAAPEPSGDDDVVAAVRELLDRRAGCFDELDLACLETVVQPGSAAEADEVAAMGVARDGGEIPQSLDVAGISVTAEMGGAVLVSVPYAAGEREPASLLVMRGEAGWRLREIFD